MANVMYDVDIDFLSAVVRIEHTQSQIVCVTEIQLRHV